MTAQCHREVADRDGIACPCDRPAVGLCPDFDGGAPYPVCRRHLPTDAEMDEYMALQRSTGWAA